MKATRIARRPFSVLVVGAGKVGSSLGRALTLAHVDATVVSARSLVSARRAGAPSPLGRDPRPSMCIIAVRDAQIADVASALASLLPRSIPLLHTAGALGPEVLAHVAALGFSVAQMHPLLSFASRLPPKLRGATLLVGGDPAALRAGRRLARTLGLVPRSYPELPRPVYHAAAALLANGAAALAQAAVDLLEKGGVPRRAAAAMAAPLLESVAQNVLSLGVPEALSGPVRRGDTAALERHWRAISPCSREIRELYLASVAVQIRMAREIAEAPPRALADMARWLHEAGSGKARPPTASRRPKAAQIKIAQRASKRPEKPAKR